MADKAFQVQYRQEFIAGFEQKNSILRDCVTTEAVVKGNQATFLVADSGNAEAVTRGLNGRIPGRADNLNQPVATLEEWHDKVEKTGFNIFASQGDQKRIMQMTSSATLHRKIDQQILDALSAATNNTGSAAAVSMTLVQKAIVKLGQNEIPFDGGVAAIISPGFLAGLQALKEFASADYVNKKPIDGGDALWKDSMGYYMWNGVKWLVHPRLAGVGTSSETCYMFHRNSIAHASPSNLIQTAAGYNEEDDFSFARTTAYMGGKLLQNSGVIKILHDASGYQ